MAKPEHARPGTPPEVMADVAARRVKLVKMRIDGHTWQQCSDALGYSAPAAAYADMQRALAASRKEFEVKQEEYRELEIQRLDDLEKSVRAVMTEYDTKLGEIDAELDAAVRDGDETRLAVLERREKRVTDQRLAATDRLLKIAERRAKLLGLDQAQKIEVSGQVLYAIEGVNTEGLV